MTQPLSITLGAGAGIVAEWGTPCDQFMILNRYSPALERNSWGGIKSLF